MGVKSCQKPAVGPHPSPHQFFIKLSRNSLTNAAVLDRIQKLSPQQTGLPNKLVIELSSTDALDVPSTVLNVMSQLHEQGFQCGLEHYSSSIRRELLHNFPVKYIKFDRSLTERRWEDKQKQYALASAIQEAKHRHITLIASYVENSQALPFLFYYEVDLL